MYVKACKNLRFLDCGSDLKKSRMSQHVGAICLTRNGPKAVAERLNGQNLWGIWLGSPLKPTKRISTDFGLRANWILRLWPCPHSSKSPRTSPVLHIKQGLVEDLAKYEKCMKYGSKWSSMYQLSGQRVAWPICFKDINILRYALNILCACWRHRERKHFSHCHKTWTQALFQSKMLRTQSFGL